MEVSAGCVWLSTSLDLPLVRASLEAGIKFYEVYARACGFTPRKHSTKTLRGGVAHQKFVVCNRQGFRESKPKQRPRTKDDENMGNCSSTASTVNRRVKITRIGCRAYVRFALLHGLDGPAMIDEFSEVHNHRLTSVCNRDLDKISRSLDMFQKTLILDNSKLNIGAGLTFRQVKELVNGYENIGATLIDFKNFQRDIKCYIGLRDADLFIDRLEKLKATQPQFYFAYDVDSQNRLTKFFWADATCIRNYSFFGDAVSFDPTYGTNKYDMVFTPFTSVNHHRKSVLFAGCLLLHEDDISFQWTFQRFLDCHGTKEPRFMITDQCPGIKKASLLYVAYYTKDHGQSWFKDLCRDTDFLARFNAVVWDPDMEPSEFEEKWQKVISDFELEDNDWLTTMFDDRHHWIPAYHRDLALGCILRTTQRSKSTNSFFKRYENHFGSKSTMDQSAIHEGAMIITNDHSFPELKTELPIEKHGAIIYTHAVFKVFQEEVMAADSCGVDDFEKEEHVRIIHAYFVGVQGQRNWANTKQIVGVLKTLPVEHTEELASLLVEFRQKLCIEPLTKDQEMEMLLGCSSSSQVTIHPPEQARNKGSGKRLKSAKQQAIEKAAKPKRLCAYCKERVTHDRRTCPLRIAAM
ncbi:protein FAR1-RELATED SEQUENCE 5-like [Silene latifolia]|uniref:protein FAR1-RELATED SEQUENCE 5-like n=1 Tax=Silene latifolia TaxID=37657 RepID=UPI003D77E0FF